MIFSFFAAAGTRMRRPFDDGMYASRDGFGRGAIVAALGVSRLVHFIHAGFLGPLGIIGTQRHQETRQMPREGDCGRISSGMPNSLTGSGPTRSRRRASTS